MRFSEPVLVGSYGPPTATSTFNVFIPNTGGNLKLPLTLDTAATTPTELLRRPGDIMGEVHDFRFIVREGDNDPTGISVAANTLVRTQVGDSPNTYDNNQRAVIHDIAYNHVCDGGVSNWRIQTGSGNVGGDFEGCDASSDTHPALAAQIDHKIDGTRPVLESVEFANTPADPDGYAIGEAIVVTATFSERVWVYGSPVVNLQVGSSLKEMTYYPLTTTNASGTVEYLATSTPRFVYEVEEGDEDTDGLMIPENAFSMPTDALIEDVARNEVLDSGIVHDAVATDSTRKVDGVRATIESASFISTPSYTSGSADTYMGGDEVAVEVTFSEPVDTFPAGALMDMEITLADLSTTTRQMVADGATSTTAVVFRYTITDTDQGTGLKIPEDPFGTPISEFLEQATASTTLEDLLAASGAALHIVDKVSNASDLSMDELNPANSTNLYNII